MPVRQVEDISIVEWAGPVVGEIRSLLENGGVKGILLNMEACSGLRADNLETLTEALTVCKDRNCTIGMFNVSNRLAQLVQITGLEPDIPPIMGNGEEEALARLRNGSPETSVEPVLEFEIDLGPATAPTARFDSATVTSAGTPSMSSTAPANQADRDLLAVHWVDLVSQGYVLGGNDADAIMAEVASDPAPSPTDTVLEDGVIDLGDMIPARRTFATEVMPTFKLDDSGSGEWSARPTGEVEVEFAPAQPGLTTGPAGVFGGEGGDFSPVDATGNTPPPAVLEARARAMPPAPAPVPAPAAPAAYPDDGDETIMFQPGALDAALLQAGMPGTPAPAPAPAVPVQPPPQAPSEGDQDQTIMFQPGALDAALLAEVAAAVGPETQVPAPAIEAPPQEPTPIQANQIPDGHEVELRLFLHDYAISSDLHIQMLDRFMKARDEILGRQDLQVATGGARAAVLEIVDQFVQSRLVRRTRSPRIRGGSGFAFSPSPRTSNTVQRLLKMWHNPQSRARIVTWLKEQT